MIAFEKIEAGRVGPGMVVEQPGGYGWTVVREVETVGPNRVSIAGVNSLYLSPNQWFSEAGDELNRRVEREPEEGDLIDAAEYEVSDR